MSWVSSQRQSHLTCRTPRSRPSLAHSHGFTTSRLGRPDDRRLAKALGTTRYGGETPSQFFTDCYELRSRLVHGGRPRPARDEVARRAANLEVFVGDLLS